MIKNCLFALSCFVCVMASRVTAQDKDVENDKKDPIRIFEPAFSIEVGSDGQIQLIDSTVIRLAPFFPGERLLRSEILNKELEILGTQGKDVESLLGRIDNKRKEFNARVRLQDRNAYSDSEVAEYWSIGSKFEVEISKILLPHQLERCKELAARLSIRNQGYPNFFEQLPSEFGIEISREELRLLDTKCKELDAEIDEKLAEISVTFFQRATNSLTRTQKKIFQDQISSPFQVTDFLIAEIDHLSETGEDDSFLRPEQSIVDAAGSPIVLMWSANDGSWSRVQANPSKIGGVMVLLEQLVGFRTVGGLTDIQETQLLELRDSLNSQLSNINEQFASVVRNGEKDEIAKMAQVKTERIEQLESQLEAKLVNQILLPHQLEMLNEYLDVRRKKRLGPIVLLLSGAFDKSLNISLEQQKELKKDSFEACKRLKSDLFELEENNLTELLKTLDDSKASEIKAVVGEPLKYLYPSVLLLRKNLSSKQ